MCSLTRIKPYKVLTAKSCAYFVASLAQPYRFTFGELFLYEIAALVILARNDGVAGKARDTLDCG